MRTADPVRLQRIFDSAVSLFAERRFHEVRMDDISTRAGVSKGLLYQHFKDKDELYLEIIIRGLEQLQKDVQFRLTGTQNPEEKLRGLIQEVVRFFNQNPSYVELMEIIKRSRSQKADEIRGQFLSLLLEIMRELDASGRWRVRDPELSARTLMVMIRGLMSCWQVPAPADLPERIAHQFLYGLTKT
jgi:AcrR family transcriptional regulator